MSEQLEKTDYDVLVVGTGPAECIVAAACARVGKSVLHIDRNEYYGSASASFSMKDLPEFFKGKEDANPEQTAFLTQESDQINVNEAFNPLNFKNFEAFFPADPLGGPNESVLGRLRSYNLDLTPQLFLSRGPIINLLISSDVGRYLEFKALEKLFIYQDNGWEQVPLSKEDVFSSSSVGVIDKRRLMKFLTFCLDYQNQPQEYIDQKDELFSTYLTQKQITGKLQSFILNAIALDQTSAIKTEEGIKKIKEHLSSLGKFGSTAFLSNMYGFGEASQAFCRLSAIFGGIYMLRCWPKQFLMGEQDGKRVVRGIQLSNDQMITADHVVTNLDYVPSQESNLSYSRAIVITKGHLHTSTKIDLSIIPPNTLGNAKPIFILQSDSAAGIAPEPFSVCYLSMVSSGNSAKEELKAVIDALLQIKEPKVENTETEENKEKEQGEDEQPGKPELLYCAYYNQSIRVLNWENKPSNLHIIPDSEQNVVNEDAPIIGQEIFSRMFPNEEFLPATPHPEEAATVEAILLEESKQQELDNQNQPQSDV